MNSENYLCVIGILILYEFIVLLLIYISSLQLKEKNGMLLRNTLKLIILIFVFEGCKVSKLQIDEIGRTDFCQISEQLIIQLQEDKEFRKHFGIENEKGKYFYDSLVIDGVPFFFHDKIAQEKAKKSNKTIEEIYEDKNFFHEILGNRNRKYDPKCSIKYLEEKDAEIRMKFWFSKNLNLVSIEAINILKEPEYSIGYLQIFEIGEKGNLKNISKTSWDE